MRRLESPWHRIGINKAAVEPLIDDWIEDLKSAAFKTRAARQAAGEACDERLLNRLNDIADEHGMQGELRGQFFAVVQEIKEERAVAAMDLIREAALRPRVVIVKQSGGCAPVVAVMALLGLLAIVLRGGCRLAGHGH
ncbi:MAG: hypothetical protein WCJ64_27525 [Rhodospirillaceae bacterium]